MTSPGHGTSTAADSVHGRDARARIDAPAPQPTGKRCHDPRIRKGRLRHRQARLRDLGRQIQRSEAAQAEARADAEQAEVRLREAERERDTVKQQVLAEQAAREDERSRHALQLEQALVQGLFLCEYRI